MTYYVHRLKQLKTYNLSQLKADLTAGLIVSLVALPLAMSFAISIGVKPDYGIYAAVIGGIIAAIFGGSEYNVTGPTGAFVAILAGVVLEFGYEKLLVAGFLAGVILLLAGLFKFGTAIQYIPYPVVIGFTTGIAVLIFTSQLGGILGLSDLEKFEYFHQNIREIFSHVRAMNPEAVLITVFTILVMLYLPKLNKLIPSALIGVILSSVLVVLLDFEVPTIQSVFGGIANSLPAIQIPKISFQLVVEMLPAALVIAMLGSIESLLSCVIADGMTKKNHHSNSELIGQGIANIITPMFGGIPVTGAIARTAVNVKSGAATRFAAIFHALFLLAMMFIFSEWVAYIPLAALGGVLAVVSYRMAELQNVKELIIHGDRMDSAVLMTTLFLTVFLNITISITVGLVLAALLFMRRISELHVIPTSIDRSGHEHRFVPSNEQVACPHLRIYTIEGPLFFGAARQFINLMSHIDPTKAIILRFKQVPVIDSTGVNAVKQIVSQWTKKSKVYFSGVQEPVMESLKENGVIDLLGEHHVFKRTSGAISQALIDQGMKNGCEEFEVHAQD